MLMILKDFEDFCTCLMLKQLSSEQCPDNKMLVLKIATKIEDSIMSIITLFFEDCELVPEAEKKGGDADEDDAEVQEDDELAAKVMTKVKRIMVMIFSKTEKKYDSWTA